MAFSQAYGPFIHEPYKLRLVVRTIDVPSLADPYTIIRHEELECGPIIHGHIGVTGGARCYWTFFMAPRCFFCYRLRVGADPKGLSCLSAFLTHVSSAQTFLELDMEDEKQLSPEQLAELRRLTKLLLEKAASLGITVVPHHQISGGRVNVWGVDESEPVTSPGHIVFPQ
jgi:hypothetical protein